MFSIYSAKARYNARRGFTRCLRSYHGYYYLTKTDAEIFKSHRFHQLHRFSQKEIKFDQVYFQVLVLPISCQKLYQKLRKIKLETVLEFSATFMSCERNHP